MGVRSMLVLDRWCIATRDGGLWKIDSVGGVLSFERYRNWPSPPVRLHTSHRLRSDHVFEPPFMNYFGGGGVDYGPVAWADGQVVVALTPEGSVDWDTYFDLLKGDRPSNVSPPMAYACAIVQYWAIAVPFALAPAVSVIAIIARSIKQRSRRARGLCPDCGYDIRATPTTGGALLARCPECGGASVEHAHAVEPLRRESRTVADGRGQVR